MQVPVPARCDNHRPRTRTTQIRNPPCRLANLHEASQVLIAMTIDRSSITALFI